jgi:plastocyanin
MRLRFGALLAAVGLFATACGGGGSGPSVGVLPTSPSPTGASEPASPPGHGHCAADLAANAADHGERAAAGPADRIVAGDFFFDPTCLADVPAGTFSLLVTNSGAALHNFSLPAQGIDQDIGPGQKVTVTITVGATALQYFCKYHRTSGMVGALLPETTRAAEPVGPRVPGGRS